MCRRGGQQRRKDRLQQCLTGGAGGQGLVDVGPELDQQLARQPHPAAGPGRLI